MIQVVVCDLLYVMVLVGAVYVVVFNDQRPGQHARAKSTREGHGSKR